MVERDDGLDESPGRALLTALAAMAGVALLVGLAVGGVVVGVVGTGGDGGGPDPVGDAESLYIPRPTATDEAEPELELPGGGQETPDVELPEGSPSPRTDRITLFAAPQAVAPGERINLNGVYVDGEGVELRIQRRQGGGWVDFPVTVVVHGGSFDTWIQTSIAGDARFRVYDAEANRASNPVEVRVG